MLACNFSEQRTGQDETTKIVGQSNVSASKVGEISDGSHCASSQAVFTPFNKSYERLANVNLASLIPRALRCIALHGRLQV